MSFKIERVLISDEIDQQCVNVFKKNSFDVVKNTKLSKEQLLEEIKNFDALVVRSATKVTADVINAGGRLKVIGRAGTGVDNIDCEAATRRGVLVLNTPAGNSISAAEHTCTLICCLSRHVAQARASMVEGRWDRKAYIGRELMGKTLAILGLGRIGREVALRMQSFGMRTIGFDPIIAAEESAKFNVESLPLEAIWPQADYITVHTPLIPQTRNLINSEVLSKCQPHVRIINVARGGIVDEAALLQALENGKCGGAALDVFVEEPPSNSALTRHPLVVATPHLGASTEEAQLRVALEIASALVSLSRGEALLGAVNGQSLGAALSASSQPWLRLLSALARAVQWRPTDALTARLCCPPGAPLRGLVPALRAQLLCAGLGEGSWNLISGPPEASARGVKVEVVLEDAEREEAVLEASGAKVQGAVVDGKPMLTSIAGEKLRQPLLMTGGCVTCVRAELKTIAGALANNDVKVICLTATTNDSVLVLLADRPLQVESSYSFTV